MLLGLRLIGAAILLAVAGFCIFGFMATYEYTEPSQRWLWQLFYGLIGASCLLGTAALFRPRQSSTA